MKKNLLKLLLLTLILVGTFNYMESRSFDFAENELPEIGITSLKILTE